MAEKVFYSDADLGKLVDRLFTKADRGAHAVLEQARRVSKGNRVRQEVIASSRDDLYTAYMLDWLEEDPSREPWKPRQRPVDTELWEAMQEAWAPTANPTETVTLAVPGHEQPVPLETVDSLAATAITGTVTHAPQPRVLATV